MKEIGLIRGLSIATSTQVENVVFWLRPCFMCQLRTAQNSGIVSKFIYEYWYMLAKIPISIFFYFQPDQSIEFAIIYCCTLYVDPIHPNH